MKDPFILARCNLFGVLKNLECLSDEDPDFRKLAESKDISIQFIVRKGPRGQLEIKNGKIRMREGRYPSQVVLYFTSPDHFNRMVDGTANPIPLKGFIHLNYLTGTFGTMTDILAKYLRLPERGIVEREHLVSNTTLTAYTAFASLAEIANHDELGRACAQTIPDGTIQIAIKNGPGVQLQIKDGRMSSLRGYAESPRAFLSFRDTDAAHAILNNKTDSYTALALGEMEMRGFIPMIEHMNPILDRVSYYLN